MFQAGEYVVYGTNGICRVKDVTRLEIPGCDKEREYYVLEPIYISGSQSFVPVDNTKVILRSVLTKQQALDLIREIPEIEEIWVEDDKTRELRFKEMIHACDCKQWIRVIKTIYLRKMQRIAQGKKMTATDERYMRLAEDNLYSELGFALQIDKSQMESYIAGQIQKKEKEEVSR